MRGASAIQELLAKRPDADLRVLAVWEPILNTDVMKPFGFVLGRLADHRAVQYWDPQHAVARQLASARDALKPQCCERDGILWDVAALYPPGALWTDVAPRPVFLNGPVAKRQSEIEAALLSAALTARIRRR